MFVSVGTAFRMHGTSLPFPGRTDAGHSLAKQLERHRSASDTLVLALVRGGVVIGRSIADELRIPLFPYVVRKLGHPENREYGMGAIAEGGAMHMDEKAMQWNGVTWEQMQPIIEEETKEMTRRKKAYLIDARPPLAGKTVILTDDGAATGATLFAAIEDLRNAKVRKIILALPVCPSDTAITLRGLVDEAVILTTPTPFNAVGQWYRDFPQVEDEEVLSLLSAQ